MNQEVVVINILEGPRVQINHDKIIAPNIIRYKKLPDISLQEKDYKIVRNITRNPNTNIGVIRRPDYYSRLPQNPYQYQKPDWWG